jgi:hypothetical protein
MLPAFLPLLLLEVFLSLNKKKMEFITSGFFSVIHQDNTYRLHTLHINISSKQVCGLHARMNKICTMLPIL